MSTELLAPRAGAASRRRRAVYYPDGDGKPMAETNPHVSFIIHVRQILRHWLRPVEKACVYADMFIYYREGHPKARVAPDVFVVWGVPYDELRRSYKLWEEQQAPQVIFEITSRETQTVDLGKKRFLYARLGVAEYYLFDPFGEYLNPPLRGYQLAGDEYVLRPIEALLPPSFDGRDAGLPSGDYSQGWRLTSEWLKLEIWALAPNQPNKPYDLRFYDPAAGKWLIGPDQAMIECESFERQAREADARAVAEAYARKAEAEARKAAEERAARLEAELEKLRGKDGSKLSNHA
ncbi:Uma2 family endonuclease [candidate division KSB1 bacterium]|nr:Uma2 family endonuclease [candidate division KSB1 bacterium]